MSGSISLRTPSQSTPGQRRISAATAPALLHDPEQDVLGSDVLGVQPLRLATGEADHIPDAFRELFGSQRQTECVPSPPAGASNPRGEPVSCLQCLRT
jgi:hypothetical protein